MKRAFRAGLFTLLLVWLSGVAPAAALGEAHGAAGFLTAARLWPASEYTRVTLEARAPLHWNLFSIEHPDRLVLDLDGLEPSAATDALPGRVRRDDPWVRAIRVGRFKPGTLRIVLDLKQAVKASASLLEPVADYGYRLVIDIHPVTPPDPLMALLGDSGRGAEVGPGAPTAGAPASSGAGSGWTASAGDANASAAAPPAAPGRNSAETAQAGAPRPGVDASAAALPAGTPAAAAAETPRPAAVETHRTVVADVPRPSAVDTARPAAAETSRSGAGDATRSAAPEAPRTPPASAPAVPAVSNPYGPAATEATASDIHPEPVSTDARRGKAGERLITIAIDAGHGGEDPGAHGDAGTLEKDVTLAIARRIRDIVNQEPGLRGVLIRDDDYFIPLQGRTSKARQMRADVFVSIHADAYINREARGSSVFALSERGATSVAARWLANRENQADLIGGVNLNARDPFLAQTLFDLSQTATIQDSLRLARTVLKELGELNPLHRGEVEQAGFAVLKSPDIPSILVETAFITNPAEERRLGDAHYQDKLATTIVRGLRRYLVAHPPAGKPRLTSAELPVPARP